MGDIYHHNEDILNHLFYYIYTQSIHVYIHMNKYFHNSTKFLDDQNLMKIVQVLTFRFSLDAIVLLIQDESKRLNRGCIFVVLCKRGILFHFYDEI